MTENVYPRARCFQVRINTRAAGKINQKFDFDPDDPVSRALAQQKALAFARQVKMGLASPAPLDPVLRPAVQPATSSELPATLRPLLERYRNEILPTTKGRKQSTSRVNLMLGVRARRGEVAPKSQRGKGLAASVLDKPLRDLEVADFKEFVESLAQTGRYVNSSINGYTSILSACLTWARKQRGMSWLQNQARGCSLRVSDARTRVAGDHEIDQILVKAGGPVTQLAVLLLIESVARRSEIASIHWKRVSLQRTAGRWPSFTFIDTKNGESRTVPLSPRAISLLEALPGPREGWVLKSPKNPETHIRPDSITQMFMRGRKRAKLENLRLHDLRHTGTTRLAKVVKDSMKLAKITGHKDARTLARYYNPTPKDLAEELGWAKRDLVQSGVG